MVPAKLSTTSGLSSKAERMALRSCLPTHDGPGTCRPATVSCETWYETAPGLTWDLDIICVIDGIVIEVLDGPTYYRGGHSA